MAIQDKGVWSLWHLGSWHSKPWEALQQKIVARNLFLSFSAHIPWVKLCFDACIQSVELRGPAFAAPPCPSFLWKLGPDFHDTGLEIRAHFPQNPPLEIGAQFGPRVGESRLVPFACKLGRLPTIGQIWVARLAMHLRLLHSHGFRPQPGHTKSKVQNPNERFGFWIL